MKGGGTGGNSGGGAVSKEGGPKANAQRREGGLISVRELATNSPGPQHT